MPDSLTDLEEITSSANPLVKLARQLATRRRARHREQLYLIEGDRAIRTACEHGSIIHTFIIDSERRGAISAALVACMEGSLARRVAIDSNLFASISDAEHPQPVIAIARMPDVHFPSPSDSIVALDAIRDPGNLGTIIRTAAAAGIDGIALLPGCVDPYHPAVVRASAGTIASVPIMQFAQVSDIVATHMTGFSAVMVAAADSEGDIDYREADWREPHILVAGNEAHGLSETVRAATTTMVRIPMAEGVESLNVSVATGILLFHIRTVREGR